MFEKDKRYEKYERADFTFEEQLFEKYMQLRQVASVLENFKYEKIDDFENKEYFKQGFLAGVKIMSSILLDI